jgi:hypothetical protein
MFKDLIIGGTAGIISRTLTAPLELYKIQAQNNYLKDSNIKNVLHKEGFRYLWKGNLTNCFRAFPQFGISYSVYTFSKNKLFNKVENKNNKHFYSGGVAGLISMSFIYPLETIRTRLSLQMNKSHYDSINSAFKKMKLGELYNGLNISLLGYIPFTGFNFMFYNYYKNKFKHVKHVNDNCNKLLSGGFSGISSLCITYPTDLVRRRLQMQGFSNKIPIYNGVFDTFYKIIKTEGFFALYGGFLVANIRIFPCVGIQFWCLENGKKIFN